MIIETKRLYLRELTMDDLADLFPILSDPQSMQHYPAPFTYEKVKGWIQWNIENYAAYGFGLWAVILKENNQFIGDCGITMQSINGNLEPEIGYHINSGYTCKGYATEAARACRNYAFENLNFPQIYSYMKYTNTPSRRVAEKNDMQFLMEINDETNTITCIYSITRKEYQKLSGQTVSSDTTANSHVFRF